MANLETISDLVRERNQLEIKFREAQLEVDAAFAALAIFSSGNNPTQIPDRVKKHLAKFVSRQGNKEVSFRAA